MVPFSLFLYLSMLCLQYEFWWMLFDFQNHLLDPHLIVQIENPLETIVQIENPLETIVQTENPLEMVV